jgi:hypothetical protein
MPVPVDGVNQPDVAVEVVLGHMLLSFVGTKIKTKTAKKRQLCGK